MASDKVPGDPGQKTILIVDDEVNIVLLLSHVVRGEGFKAATAADGDEALMAVEKCPPDVIILDLMMPNQGGYEMLRELQAGPHSRIPIIIVSARATDLSTVHMLEQESNVAGFLQKPIDMPGLILLLHRLLKTQRKTSF